MLTNVINELAQLLIGQTPTLKLSDIPSKIYTDDKAILDISKLVLDNGDEWDFNRKAYVCAYNLEKYTLDLLKREDNKSISKSIEKKLKSNKNYVSFLNGPYFNMKNGVTIGRKKNDEINYNIIGDNFYEPWTNGLIISEETFIPEDMRGFGYKDKNGTLFFENTSELNDQLYNDSNMLFEGTPLLIDTEKSINHFQIEAIERLIEENPLNTTKGFIERYTMGLPFLGLSTYNNKRYLISITLEDSYNLALPDLSDVFNVLYHLTTEIKTEKLIFTDGSDSLFLNYSSEYKHFHLSFLKNIKMPFYFGIRKI